MSEIFDSFTNRQEQGLDQKKLQKLRSEFTIPQCENNSEEASFEPNISSIQKIVLNTPQLSRFNPSFHENIEDSSEKPIVQQQRNYTWGSRGLQVMFFITKFIKQMKNHSSQIKFKSLNSDILTLISDSAADSDILLQKLTKTQVLISNLKFAIDHIPVVEPDSLFKIIWDIFLLAQIILNILYIPMKLGFGFKNEGPIYSLLLETLPSLTFILDIVLNFFTAFYSKGQIHRNKGEIFRNYIHFQLWWDLLIAIPFILSSFQVQYTEYILLLRVTKVKSMIESIEEVVNPSLTMQTILELFKSVFLVLFVSHSCACLWNMIGQMELDQGKNSWLISKNIVDEAWDSRYINSLYFATITTLTIGYGDIVPQTDIERIFVILMALVICGLFGYTISSIGNILRQLTEKEQIFKQKMMILNNYLKKKNLNKQLILQVRKYFEYYFKMQDENNEMGDNMMDALNKKLKQQVAIDLYHNMLLNSRLIKQTLQEKSVKSLCAFVKEKRYAPEDVIEQQNDQANKLIFLLKGEINLICDQGNRETKLAVIKAGRFVGEKEFIVQSRYDYTIRTTKFSQIAFITYEDFLKIIKQDSLEEENYQMLKDQMIFNEEKQTYGEVCYICKWTHQFTKCPLVFFNVNLDRTRKKFMMTEDNKRQKYKRFFEQKVYNNLKLNQETALQFVVENNLLAIEDLTDQYLEQLGILQSKASMSHYQSLKSSKTITKNESSDSSEEDKSVKSKLSKLPTSNDQKKVKFVNQSPELEKKEFNRQSSKLRPISNRRTFVKLSQIQTHRFSNVSLFSQDLAGLAQQFQQQQALNQTQITNSSSAQQSSSNQNSQQLNTTQSRKLRKDNSSSYQNIENQLAIMKKMQQTRQELASISVQNLPTVEDQQKIFIPESQTRIRVDLDIDRCFTSQNYFSQGNLTTVLMKLKKPRKTQRHAAQIESIIQKSKIRQLQQFQL